MNLSIEVKSRILLVVKTILLLFEVKAIYPGASHQSTVRDTEKSMVTKELKSWLILFICFCLIWKTLDVVSRLFSLLRFCSRCFPTQPPPLGVAKCALFGCGEVRSGLPCLSQFCLLISSGQSWRLFRNAFLNCFRVKFPGFGYNGTMFLPRDISPSCLPCRDCPGWVCTWIELDWENVCFLDYTTLFLWCDVDKTRVKEF